MPVGAGVRWCWRGGGSRSVAFPSGTCNPICCAVGRWPLPRCPTAAASKADLKRSPMTAIPNCRAFALPRTDQPPLFAGRSARCIRHYDEPPGAARSLHCIHVALPHPLCPEPPFGSPAPPLRPSAACVRSLENEQASVVHPSAIRLPGARLSLASLPLSPLPSMPAGDRQDPAAAAAAPHGTAVKNVRWGCAGSQQQPAAA